MDDTMKKIGELLSDKDSVRQLSELAQMLKNGMNNADSEVTDDESADCCNSENDSFDFESFMRFGEILNMMNQEDKNSQLLLALKPHLSEKRQCRVDKAVKILKLLTVWNMMKENGMLNDFV